MSQTSLGAPASEKSTHVEEAILESRYSNSHWPVGPILVDAVMQGQPVFGRALPPG